MPQLPESIAPEAAAGRLPAAALVVVALTALLASGRAGAERLALVLEPAAGPALAIGAVERSPDGDGARVRVEFDESLFEDHFLSMRPFRCLPVGEQLLCRLPYPYENRRRVSGDDLTDLEYELLFIGKSRSEYGIDVRDGLYWKLARSGDGYIGTPYAVDYAPLGVPPPAGELRPLKPDQLWEIEPGRAPFVRLRIGTVAGS